MQLSRVLPLLCLLAVSALADEVIFRGRPSVRVFTTAERDIRETLDDESASKNECVIATRGKQYVWVSRQGAPLTRVDAGEFSYFIHRGGEGYVKVFNGSREAAKAPTDYIEHINRGFDTVTYFGRARGSGQSDRP